MLTKDSDGATTLFPETLTRGQQLRLLRECVLQKVGNVSGATQKIVLRAIDDYAGESGHCYASSERIAKETGLCAKTVKRAITALARSSAINCVTRPGRTSYLSVDWATLNRGHSVPGDMVSPGTLRPHTGDMVSATGDMVSATGDMVSPDPNRSAKETPTKRKASRRKFVFTEEDSAFAEEMKLVVHAVVPEANYDREKWANVIRLMREQDKIAIDRMREVFKYATEDTFWHGRVLDPMKLRDKFKTLAGQIAAKRPAISPGQSYQEEKQKTFGEGFP
jgi:hypothetical protein